MIQMRAVKDIYRRLDEMLNGDQYGRRITFVNDEVLICNGVRPYQWQNVNYCAECGDALDHDGMAHWDEINNTITCAGCHAS